MVLYYKQGYFAVHKDQVIVCVLSYQTRAVCCLNMNIGCCVEVVPSFSLHLLSLSHMLKLHC